MTSELLHTAVVHEAVSRWLAEDVGPADITTVSLLNETTTCKARIFAKQEGVLAGIHVASTVFSQLDTQALIQVPLEDAAPFNYGDTLMTIQGSARAILSGERVALNILQRLCGIATQTKRFVDAVAHTSVKILDTRKTTPGLRAFEKYAVHCGGGHNHRMGLYDEFMIKDNHVSLMQTQGGLKEAVARARAFDPDSKLTFEADTLEQVQTLAELGVDQILLDNMTTSELTKAVKIVAGRALCEASGNMTLERVKEVAETGVDFISIGALTHSVPALDLSLEIVTS
jgi:nicotinate-nucleotide pyrophosphorylase (carboxylating)